MINYQVGSIKTQVRQWVFPGGEVGVDINVGGQMPVIDDAMVIINAQIQNANDLMALIFTVDALKRHFLFGKFVLNLSYLPYARQDRVCNNGESHSLRVVADMINNLKLDFVEVMDVHSTVSEALMNRLNVLTQYEIFCEGGRGPIRDKMSEYYIVAPDMGASKKAHDFARLSGAKGVISFNKVRNLQTGKIIETRCMDVIDPKGKFMVVDDICDGGRTFLELAKCFPDTVERLELMVTHGIFSKGIDILLEEYDHIYTTDSFRSDIEQNERVTVIRRFA